MRLSHSARRATALKAVLLATCIFSFIGCSTPSTPPTPSTPAATPTLLGTVVKPASPSPTGSPRPEACIFRPSPTTEIGLYRFNWEDATLTLDTKLGPVIVDGPRTLNPGPRRLILAYNADLTTSLSVVINFDVGGSLIYDLAGSAQEVRDAGGSVLIQNLADPIGDTKGLPAYLDIARIERTFGYYPNSLVRVYLGGVRSGPQIWTFQNVTVSVGGEAYTYQSSFDDKTVLSVTDSRGRTKEWPGPVTVEENSVTFALQTGWSESVSASTSTSGGEVDTAGPFPVKTMQQIWDATLRACP